MPIKKEKVREHISKMGGLFDKRDPKKHTYLAIPEQSVLKEGDCTPFDLHPKAVSASNPSVIPTSLPAVAAGNALESKHSTTQVINEQVKAVQESDDEKLLRSFGMKPDELKVQHEQYGRLEGQQLENAQRRELYPGATGSGVNGDSQQHFASGQGGGVMQEYRRSPGLNRRHTYSFERQTSKKQQAAQAALLPQSSHKWKVGTAVELVNPPGYGTVRWIGKFPAVDQAIAGVETVSCAVVLSALAHYTEMFP